MRPQIASKYLSTLLQAPPGLSQLLRPWLEIKCYHSIKKLALNMSVTLRNDFYSVSGRK